MGSGKGGGSGKSVTSSGTNGQGNTYTNYSDGGYRYSNSSGSSYYDTGKGHSFYNRAPRGQVECPTPLTPTRTRATPTPSSSNPRGLVEYPTQLIPIRTRATPTPITSNHQPEPGLLQHQVQVICRSCCCQEACSAVLLHNSYFVY